MFSVICNPSGSSISCSSGSIKSSINCQIRSNIFIVSNLCYRTSLFTIPLKTNSLCQQRNGTILYFTLTIHTSDSSDESDARDTGLGRHCGRLFIGCHLSNYCRVFEQQSMTNLFTAELSLYTIFKFFKNLSLLLYFSNRLNFYSYINANQL